MARLEIGTTTPHSSVAETSCEFCNCNHEIAVPTVHMNGTSASELLRQLDEAVAAVRQAIDCTLNAEPNSRDYYVQPGGPRIVMHQHRVRVELLGKVLKELTEMRDHVQAVIDFKEGRRDGRWPSETCEQCREIYWVCNCGAIGVEGIVQNIAELPQKPTRCNNPHHTSDWKFQIVTNQVCCQRSRHNQETVCEHCGQKG
jgi:hypothetical protein